MLQVYDVTSFLDDHPGGDESLISSTGKDATVDFEDVGHSDSAVEMMHKYFIGYVDTSSSVPTQVNHTQQPPSTQPNNVVVGDQSSSSGGGGGFVAKTLQFLLPLLILVFAFALQHYSKNKQITGDS